MLGWEEGVTKEFSRICFRAATSEEMLKEYRGKVQVNDSFSLLGNCKCGPTGIESFTIQF